MNFDNSSTLHCSLGCNLLQHPNKWAPPWQSPNRKKISKGTYPRRAGTGRKIVLPDYPTRPMFRVNHVGRKGADSNDSIINTREFFVSSALRIPPRLPCARRSRAVAPHLHSQVPLCPASVFALHIASQGAARGMLSGRYLYQTDLPAARPRRCADPCRFVAADSPSQSVCHAPPPATRPVWATRCRAGRPGFVPQAPELERTSITVTTVANAKPWP